MKSRHILVIAVAAVALGSWSAGAATGKDRLRQQAETLCAGDATRLCGDTMGDDAKTAECMKMNQAQLSPACRKASKALNAR